MKGLAALALFVSTWSVAQTVKDIDEYVLEVYQSEMLTHTVELNKIVPGIGPQRVTINFGYDISEKEDTLTGEPLRVPILVLASIRYNVAATAYHSEFVFNTKSDKTGAVLYMSTLFEGPDCYLDEYYFEQADTLKLLLYRNSLLDPFDCIEVYDKPLEYTEETEAFAERFYQLWELGMELQVTFEMLNGVRY